MSHLIFRGDARSIPLPDQSVHTCITSPPYWGLRDYGVDGQIGMESTPQAYVAEMVRACREVKRILRDDGTFWLNVGDSYQSGKGMAGGSKKYAEGTHVADAKCQARRFGLRPTDVPNPDIKPKNLIGIPWRLAFALQDDGWYLRSDIIWNKPNPIRESVTDRLTRCHEYLFLLSKKPRYFYDNEAIKVLSAPATKARMEQNLDGQKGSMRANGGRKTNGAMKAVGEPGRANKMSVWTVATTPTKEAHFATFPPKLIIPCIKAGTSEKGCCPRCGSPWKRVVEKVRVPTRPGVESKVYATVPVHPDSPLRSHNGDICGNRDPQRHVTQTRTLGWESGCLCPEGRYPVPCTVFDPFVGSGTTIFTAENLGRDAVGMDLSGDYLRIARTRIRKETRPVSHYDPAPARAPLKGQMSLFE